MQAAIYSMTQNKHDTSCTSCMNMCEPWLVHLSFPETIIHEMRCFYHLQSECKRWLQKSFCETGPRIADCRYWHYNTSTEYSSFGCREKYGCCFLKALAAEGWKWEAHLFCCCFFVCCVCVSVHANTSFIPNWRVLHAQVFGIIFTICQGKIIDSFGTLAGNIFLCVFLLIGTIMTGKTFLTMKHMLYRVIASYWIYPT